MSYSRHDIEEIEYKFDYYIDKYDLNKYIDDYYIINSTILYEINIIYHIIKIECGICNICIKFENKIDRDKCHEKLNDILKLGDYNLIKTFIKDYNGVMKE
jgi:hypothetical protein